MRELDLLYEELLELLEYGVPEEKVYRLRRLCMEAIRKVGRLEQKIKKYERIRRLLRLFLGVEDGAARSAPQQALSKDRLLEMVEC